MQRRARLSKMRHAHRKARAMLAMALLCAATLTAQDQPTTPTNTPRVTETERRLGGFTAGGMELTVIARSQTIASASNRRFATTDSELEIRDANANPVVRETFPGLMNDGRFAQTLTVSASLLEGRGGKALVLRFLEDSGGPAAAESWQMFGMVSGKMTRYGAPLPLGQGGAAVNGVLAGVMLQGGIGVVPLASTAEELEFRVWTGNFFVDVPVRIDWERGQWSEGEQCFSNEGGSLQPTGCNLRVAVSRGPVEEGAVVMLYAQPEEDPYSARPVPVHSDSRVTFPAARGVVRWQGSGNRFSCTVEDLWLRATIDGNEGWVHSSSEFAALGLSR
jgi:hypothetical protein